MGRDEKFVCFQQLLVVPSSAGSAFSGGHGADAAGSRIRLAHTCSLLSVDDIRRLQLESGVVWTGSRERGVAHSTLVSSWPCCTAALSVLTKSPDCADGYGRDRGRRRQAAPFGLEDGPAATIFALAKHER